MLRALEHRSTRWSPPARAQVDFFPSVGKTTASRWIGGVTSETPRREQACRCDLCVPGVRRPPPQRRAHLSDDDCPGCARCEENV
jgi:hypothetical protein